MLKNTRPTLVAIALLGSVAMAIAQTTPDPHHPAAPPAAAAPAAAAPGGAMPAQGGKEGGGMPMMDMGKMMQMMRGMMSGGGMGMMPFEHVEGRIAFLKAELAITDAQMPQWNAFADAVRAGAKDMQEAMSKMMQAGVPTTAPAKADAMVQMMAARLEAMKAMVRAGKALYDTLSDPQRKIADELMSPRMGMGMGMGMGRTQ